MGLVSGGTRAFEKLVERNQSCVGNSWPECGEHSEVEDIEQQCSSGSGKAPELIPRAIHDLVGENTSNFFSTSGAPARHDHRRSVESDRRARRYEMSVPWLPDGVLLVKECKRDRDGNRQLPEDPRMALGMRRYDEISMTNRRTCSIVVPAGKRLLFPPGQITRQ